jgi:hypothetical protein
MPEPVTRTTRLCDLSAPLFALCFSMRGAKDPG